MDLSSLMGGGKPPEKEQTPALEYTAQAVSPLVNGEVKLAVDEDGLAVTALLDAAVIPYADITALELADYAVTVKTDGGKYAFSRMGSWCQPFYDALVEAYNRKVLKALFVTDKPLLKTTGLYQYMEDGVVTTGTAPIQVHENCVCVLPPNLAARRISLCFLDAFDKGDYDISLTLITGERYTFSKLGYGHQPLSACIEKQLRALKGKALDAVKETDPSLTAAQASAIAKLMPEGAAVPIGDFATIAPSFVDALNKRVGESRIAESAGVFAKLCNPAQICVGIKRNFAGTTPPTSAGGMDALARLAPETNVAKACEDVKVKQSMMWLLAPGRKAGTAAVEFIGGEETSAATFLYQFTVPWDAFWRRLNVAMEAIGFKREVIRLSDEEMQMEGQADYRMAVERNHSLRYIRTCFAGRVIHRTADSWKREMAGHLS